LYILSSVLRIGPHVDYAITDLTPRPAPRFRHRRPHRGRAHPEGGQHLRHQAAGDREQADGKLRHVERSSRFQQAGFPRAAEQFAQVGGVREEHAAARRAAVRHCGVPRAGLGARSTAAAV
jgi:hypothetical protein